jgi:hypothetical protein
VNYPDTKGTSHLGQRQLHLGRSFVQKGAELEDRHSNCGTTSTRRVPPTPAASSSMGTGIGRQHYRPALASQSYITLRLISRKFITSSLTPSGSSKNVA